MPIIIHIFSINQICSNGKRSEVIISVHGTVPVQFHDFAQFLTKFSIHASVGVDVEASSIIECCAAITYAVNFPHHRQTPTDGIEIKFQGAVKKSQPYSFVELQTTTPTAIHNWRESYRTTLPAPTLVKLKNFTGTFSNPHRSYMVQ